MRMGVPFVSGFTATISALGILLRLPTSVHRTTEQTRWWPLELLRGAPSAPSLNTRRSEGELCSVKGEMLGWIAVDVRKGHVVAEKRTPPSRKVQPAR